MATVSPDLRSSLPARSDTVSPPSYTPAPPEQDERRDDDKVAIQQQPAEDKIAIPQIKPDDENLPEVVVESPHSNTNQEKETVNKMYPPPPQPQHHNQPLQLQPLQQQPLQQQPLHQQPLHQQPLHQQPLHQQHQNDHHQSQTWPQQSQPNIQQPYSTHESMSMPPQPFRPQPNHADSTTVTPLHLLANQSDRVDCPFCQNRVETKVKRNASGATHLLATGLFFSTLFGVMCPYICHFANDISHFCPNCKRKVAFKKHGTDEMQALGTPEHLRQASRFPEAPPRQKK